MRENNITLIKLFTKFIKQRRVHGAVSLSKKPAQELAFSM